MIISLIWALIFFIAAALMSGNLTLFSLGMGCLAMYLLLKEMRFGLNNYLDLDNR